MLVLNSHLATNLRTLHPWPSRRGRVEDRFQPPVEADFRGSEDPPRSLSDSGPVRDSHDSQRIPDAAPSEPEQAYVRSKSVGDILDAPINYATEEETRHKLEQLKTEVPDIEVSRPPEQVLYSSISAHDQYHGLGRQDTKTQW